MAFRWHSNVAAGTVGAKVSRPEPAAPKPAPSAPDNTPNGPQARRTLALAHQAVSAAIQSAQRNAEGKLTSPGPIVKAAEAAGVRLGPQGAGTLLAMADAGHSPTLDEFVNQIAFTPGSQMAAQPAPGPTGPGLKSLFGGQPTTKADASGRGRGGRSSGPAPAAAQGRGGRR